MKKILGFVLAATAMSSVATVAEARQGCGGGYHRGPNGGCRPNYGPRYGANRVFVGVPSIGVFYAGRGYWDGHRYMRTRYRWHGGWRYR